MAVYDQSKSSKFGSTTNQQANNSTDNASAMIGLNSGLGANSNSSQLQGNELAAPGVLRIYRYPLTGSVAELQTHGAPITKLLITRADTYLFTIGEDNLISSYKLTWDKDSSSKKLPFSDDYLYNRLDYIDKNREIALLTEKVKTTQEKIKKQNEDLQMKKDREERELQQKKLEEQRNGAMQIDEIKRQMKAMEEAYDEKMEKLRVENAKMFEEMERNNENKLAKEGIRFDEKVHKKDQVEGEYRERIVQLARRHEEEIQHKREEYREIIRREEEKRVVEQDRIKVLKEQHEQRIKLLEEQSDAAIDELRKKNDQILSNLEKEIDVQTSNLNKARAACSGKDNENRMADQNVDNIKKEINPPIKIHRVKLTFQINEATNAIQNEKQRKKNLESDIDERESTLRKKNDRITLSWCGWINSEKNQRIGEKETGTGKVQVCVEIQDWRAAKGDRSSRAADRQAEGAAGAHAVRNQGVHATEWPPDLVCERIRAATEREAEGDQDPEREDHPEQHLHKRVRVRDLGAVQDNAQQRREGGA